MPEEKMPAQASLVGERIPAQREKRFVRVHELDNKGFVHFDFAISDPALSVELTLPSEAFREFCAEHLVTQLTPEQIQRLDHEATKWRFGQSGVWE